MTQYRGLTGKVGIEGKVALVTGSMGGMGLSTVRALAAQGCNVMMGGLGEPAEQEALRRSIAEEFKVKVAFGGADLSDPEAIVGMVRQCERELGPVDILVNNAATRGRYVLPGGVKKEALIEEVPVDTWDKAVAVNLTAPYHLIRLTIPGMKQRQWGRIVNIASNYGLTGTGVGKSDYIATKHGLVGLTRAVALEALPFKVTVNAICPGSTLTPHAERQIKEWMERGGKNREETIKDFLATKQPARRFVLPEQIADLIVFLCSDVASEMTGSPISIDGGWVAG